MKRFIKFLSIALFMLISYSAFADTATAKHQEEDCNIYVIYNDTIVPGEALFVRMTIQVPKSHKKNKNLDTTATLHLYQKQKVIQHAAFYATGKSKKANSKEYLCGIPLSTWLTDNEYSLKVSFSINEGEKKEFTLPVKFKMYEYNKETIHLDEKNTSTITDNSPERAAQIKKLNAILYSVNSENVFSLKPMSKPNPSTRITSYFGDRRIYAYSNGKSSTSEHYGNDYGVPTGSEVRACADGKVVLSEWRNTTGYTVVIEHLPGLYSLYYHNSELKVKEGDTVKAGDLVAKSGATGLATGPHIHWEMRLNAAAVRPDFFLQNFTFEGINYQ